MTRRQSPTYGADGERVTVLSQARQFFIDNPGEVLFRQDLCLKFGCAPITAKIVARTLIQEGTVKRHQLPRPPRSYTCKEAREEPAKPFPECLTPSQLSALQAYIAAGNIAKASRATGRNYATLSDHLKDARRKAGVHTTAELAVLFVRAAG